MRESIFHGEWIRSWRHHYPGCHIVKVPDMPKTAGARFLPPKPYDIYAMWNGRFYAMELKLRTDLGGFPFKEATEWQINNLKEAKENGACAHFVMNYRVSAISERQRKKIGFDKKRLNRVFFIDVEDLAEVDSSLDSKSVPFKFMLESPLFKYIEKEGDFWNVPAFLAYGGNK